MCRIQSSNLALALVVVSATSMVACRLVETGAGSDSAVRVGGNPSNFTFTEIVPDIYHAQGVGDIVAMSNAGIVINDEDVLIVDSHVSPAAADVLLEDLKTVTNKPVRFVVNTHWHMDHSHGNQVYPSEVEIIGHEASRAAMVTGRSNSGRAYETFIGSVPGRIAAMEGALDTIGDPELRTRLEETIKADRLFFAQTQEVVPTPPNTTLSERMSLFRSGREIRILFFGRGHTEGDVIVHLPDDGVIITGDLLPEGLPYMGDGYVPEWIETLEHVKALDFEWIIPGHGAPYQDREKIDHLQAYLRDVWTQTVSFHGSGTDPEKTAVGIDLTAHAEHFKGAIDPPGGIGLAVLRIFELLDGTAN